MCSVRVSNELGASHPRTAKFSVAVAAITSFLISVVLSLILIAARRQYPDLFSSNAEIKKLVYSLTPLLAVCIVINNIQPVLSGIYSFLFSSAYFSNVAHEILCSYPFTLLRKRQGNHWPLGEHIALGVAVGAGWQAFIAYVNIGCYYVIGVPMGLLLGFKLDLGVKVIHSLFVCLEGDWKSTLKTTAIFVCPRLRWLEGCMSMSL